MAKEPGSYHPRADRRLWLSCPDKGSGEPYAVRQTKVRVKDFQQKMGEAASMYQGLILGQM